MIVHRAAAAAAAIAVMLLVGCSYDPRFIDGTITCEGASKLCPRGFSCVSDLCCRGGACGGAPGTGGGRPPSDGGGGGPEARDAADGGGGRDAGEVLDTRDGALDGDAADGALDGGAGDGPQERPPCPRRTTGMVTEYDIPTPNAGASNIAVAEDGTVWFTEANVAAMGRIDAAGCVTELPLPHPAYDLSRGPQHRIWFTEVGQNRVGWIGARDVVEDVAVSTRPYFITGNATTLAATSIDKFIILDAQGAMVGMPHDLCSVLVPNAIVADSDGTVWTAAANDTFNTLNAYGPTSLCYAPMSLKQVRGLAMAAGGVVWFVDAVVNVVGRFRIATPAVPLATQALPGALPARIAIAPNGVAWFTEPGTNRVGRADQGLSLQHFTLPTANAGPAGIAAADDGTVWFVEQGANRIASIP